MCMYGYMYTWMHVYMCVHVCVPFVRRVRIRANTQQSRGSMCRYIWMCVYICAYKYVFYLYDECEHEQTRKKHEVLYIDIYGFVYIYMCV